MSYLSTDTAPRLSPLTDLHADLVVRPDHVQVRFQLSVEADRADLGLSSLKEESGALLRRAREATGAEVRLRPRDMLLGPAAANKKLRLSEAEERASFTVEGVLELPLADSLDFWERSAKVTQLLRVCQEFSREEKARPRARFSPPVPRVARPEAHRAELLRRLSERLCELREALRPADVPLRPAEYTPPGPVEQTPVSLEEVTLSLRVAWHTSGPRERDF